MTTEYDTLEPAGFGQIEFGSPSDGDLEFMKGFGDMTTLYTERNDD